MKMNLHFRKLSFPEQPQEQRQDRAEEEAGDDREMKTEVGPGVIDIAGQPAEPPPAKTRPQQHPHDGDNQADDDQKFAQIIIHFSER
jgi:hypothetical protein